MGETMVKRFEPTIKISGVRGFKRLLTPEGREKYITAVMKRFEELATNEEKKEIKDIIGRNLRHLPDMGAKTPEKIKEKVEQIKEGLAYVTVCIDEYSRDISKFRPVVQATLKNLQEQFKTSTTETETADKDFEELLNRKGLVECKIDGHIQQEFSIRSVFFIGYYLKELQQIYEKMKKYKP